MPSLGVGQVRSSGKIPSQRWESRAEPNTETHQNRLTLAVEIWRNLLHILHAQRTKTSKKNAGLLTGIIGKSCHS